MEHTQTTPENMDIPTTTTTPGKKEEDIILVTSDDQHRSIPMSTINLFNTIKNAIQGIKIFVYNFIFILYI